MSDDRMFLGLDPHEVEVLVAALNHFSDQVADDVAWGSAAAERRLATIRVIQSRIATLSKGDGE